MNRVFAILIIFSLSMPVFAFDEQTEAAIPAAENAVETINTEEVNEWNNNSPEINQQDLLQTSDYSSPSKYKQPISKKKLAKKFIIAMLCVAGASVFLFGILSIYNKVRDIFIAQSPIPPEGEKPLDSPCDLTDAVKTFVEKTRWN